MCRRKLRGCSMSSSTVRPPNLRVKGVDNAYGANARQNPPIALLCPLFVSHRRTCRSRQLNDLAMAEPCLFALLRELGAGEIKCVAKFDQHVQRHQETKGVLPELIVDDLLDRVERAPGRECTVG